jgi:hypothetical protein
MKTTNNSTKDIINETYCQETNCTKDSIKNYHANENDEEDDEDYVENDYSSYDTTNKYHDAGFPDDYDWM